MASQGIASDARFVDVARPNPAKPLWHQIIDGIPDPALVLDGKSVVAAANAAARELFPVGVSRHISQVTRSPELNEALTLARQSGQQQSCHVRLIAPAERHIEGHVTPLANPAGTEGAWLLIVLRDATYQHQLAKLRADFVANASHELRTPLASLKGFIETLQGAAKDDPVARERFLGIMQEQAARMSRLIDDLLSLSLIEMREHVAPQGKVDLATVAQSVLHSLSPLAKAAGISLVLRPVKGPSTVIGDRDELAQVVQNLAQNAIKYGKPNGTVEIAIERTGSRMALSVIDDGIGIAPEHLPRLVERFYRVSAKDSRERGGTGLGLAIVKHIVNRHQGELKITSTPDVGSTFTVLLAAA